ncbi:MAG: tetratricopeptide repeat protein [Anaerolineales bacterium]|nr:tetratricopeptide repeat protein [Anaerolineales bacterium]
MDVIRSRIGYIVFTILAILMLRPTPLQHGLVSMLTKANISAASGKYEAALRHLEGATSLDNELTSIYADIAAAALASNNYAQAEKYILLHKEINPLDPYLDCLEIDLYSKQGDAKSAIELWTSSAAECQNSAIIIRELTLQLLAQGNYHLAIEAISDLTQLKPADFEMQFFRSLILATSDPERSLSFLRLTDEITPAGKPLALELVRTIENARFEESEAFTLAEVGHLLTKHGYWNYAINAFQSAIEIEPTYADAHAFLGLALDEIGKSGYQSYQHAIDLAPENSLAYIYLGIHLLRNGFPELALSKFETARELEPRNPIIAVQIAHAYELLGEVEIAIDTYKIATEFAPQNSTFWVLLAQASLNHEYNTENIGLPAARNAVAISPKSGMALDALGYCYYLLGDFDFSDRFLTRAVELEPLNPSIQYHIGILRASQDQYLDSKAAFEMALFLDPDGSIGKMAKRALETISQ